MLSRPRVGRWMFLRVASKDNSSSNFSMLHLRCNVFRWFVFNVQLVFTHVNLTFVGVTHAAVFSTVVLLSVRDDQTVSKLLRGWGKLLMNPTYCLIQQLTHLKVEWQWLTVRFLPFHFNMWTNRWCAVDLKTVARLGIRSWRLQFQEWNRR